jgi:hypothetical protein
MKKYPEITVDSRGCGSGKTTSHIYPLLAERAKRFERTLVVVAGIILQDEYQAELRKRYGIDIKCVNSENMNNHEMAISVVSKAAAAMRNHDNTIVCITNECFKRFQLDDYTRSQWHLIIDEAIDPFRSIRYDRNKSDINWDTCFKATEIPIAGDYWQTEVIEENLDSFAYNSDTMRMMRDPQWISLMKISDRDALANLTRDRAEIIQMLKPELFAEWRSCHVAAGAFEHTFMSDWFKLHQIPHQVIYGFEKQSLPMVYHNIEGLTWSKTKAASIEHQITVREYQDYVNEFCANLNTIPLALRNNNSKNSLTRETRLKHNPHGLNKYSNRVAISLETALNPSPAYRAFLRDYLGLTDQQITVRFSSYLFYQCVMRTALRLQNNTTTCHVFCLDEATVSGLLEFMEPIDKKAGHVYIPSSYRSKAMTDAERAKRYRDRVRHETSISRSRENVTESGDNRAGIFAAVKKQLTHQKSTSQTDKLNQLLKTIRIGQNSTQRSPKSLN